MRAMRVGLSPLRFFDLLGEPGAKELIDQEIALFGEMLDEWEAEKPEDPFYNLVNDYRIRQARAIVDWLEAVKQNL